MFDGSTIPEGWFGPDGDIRSSDRAALQYALGMTAAFTVLTLAAVIAIDALFPAVLDIQTSATGSFPC